MQYMVLNSFTAVSAVKVNTSSAVFIIFLIAVFIAASVISGIFTFKARMKKKKKNDSKESESDISE